MKDHQKNIREYWLERAKKEGVFTEVEEEKASQDKVQTCFCMQLENALLNNIISNHLMQINGKILVPGGRA